MKISEIEELCDKATQGPWSHAGGGRESALIEMPNETMKLWGPNAAANAEFIVYARELIPRLVSVLRTVETVMTDSTIYSVPVVELEAFRTYKTLLSKLERN